MKYYKKIKQALKRVLKYGKQKLKLFCAFIGFSQAFPAIFLQLNISKLSKDIRYLDRFEFYLIVDWETR